MTTRYSYWLMTIVIEKYWPALKPVAGFKAGEVRFATHHAMELKSSALGIALSLALVYIIMATYLAR